MTTGSTTTGAIPGYYRKRVWSGSDGGPGENAYTWGINEAYLPVVKYSTTGALWYNGSMNTFSCNFMPEPPGESVNCLNKATNKVWGQLKQSSFNLGVFSGEFRESYKMIYTIVNHFASAILAAKRGRWDKAFRLLSMSPNSYNMGSAAANSYMMVHFGILPLCSDIQAMYDYMRTHYKKVKHVRVSAGFKKTDFSSLNGVQWTRNYRCLAEVRGNVEMIELSEADRLGLTDLVSVGYELTKLSWLLDWILPIGNFLEAVNASNKTEGNDFFITRMAKNGIESPVRLPAAPIIIPFFRDAFQTKYSSGAANKRYQMSALPWVFPTIKNPLGDNLSHWVTATAFLHQSIGARHGG